MLHEHVLWYDILHVSCFDTSVLCGSWVRVTSQGRAGLQTGWITMGSLQSAILGFGIFKALKRFGLVKGFSIAENVIVQTTSVATATMPLAGISTLALRVMVYGEYGE